MKVPGELPDGYQITERRATKHIAEEETGRQVSMGYHELSNFPEAKRGANYYTLVKHNNSGYFIPRDKPNFRLKQKLKTSAYPKNHEEKHILEVIAGGFDIELPEEFHSE